MTLKQIATMQEKANIAFELAAQIRKLLDAARKEYGANEWDENEIETKIAELAFDE
jgi:hypothetical protein